MGLFIDIPRVPGELAVQAGDILRFAASGALVRSGTSVAVLAVLTDAVLGTNGQVLRPAGQPNVVLLRAVAPGRSTVDLVTGGTLASPSATSVQIVVAP